MFNTLNTEFEFYNKILNLRSLQEEVIASNVANSDTPHYKSKKINFSYELKKNILNYPISLNMTSSKHLYPKLKKIFCTTESNLNNLDNESNTVNMNHERIKFLENSLRYQAEIAFLNNNIKNITYVLQRG